MKQTFCLIAAICLVFMVSSCKTETPKTDESTTQSVNPIVDCILARRSIRAYKPEQISRDELQQILKCGINAPSARNMQPWQVYVIQNKNVIDSLNKQVLEDMKEKNPAFADKFSDPEASVFFNAPTLLLIAYDTTSYWGMSDCGMLVQNILLSAESMNIGTCAVGCCVNFLNSPKATDFLKSLDLPQNYSVYLTVTLGYKDQHPEAKPRDEQKIRFLE